MNKQEVESFLQERKLKPIKKFGQNFLINESAILKIVQTAKSLPPPFVEIGPGLGALTKHFADTKKELLLIEKDKKLAALWKSQSFSVLSADILKLDWSLLPKSFSLFGNLPYEIAARLILKSCSHQNQTQNMLLLMQKELAQRAESRPQNKNYGLLSVMSQVFWSISHVLDISKSSFYPAPKVEGRVLLFNMKKSRGRPEPHLFLQFVKKCFSAKRKMLFKQIGLKKPEAAKSALKKLGLSASCRAEELSPHQFVKLYKLIQEEK